METALDFSAGYTSDPATDILLGGRSKNIISNKWAGSDGEEEGKSLYVASQF